MNSDRLSGPSNSIDEVNVPEIRNLRAEFIYNFYVRDERVSPYNFDDDLKDTGTTSSAAAANPLKEARYVVLRWESPPSSNFETEKIDTSRRAVQENNVLQLNSDKIISEDHFFNSGFMCHTFSNIESIEQGSSDLENYSLMSGKYIESISSIAKDQINSILSSTGSFELTGEIVDNYGKLSDFPKNSLGLRVYNVKNELIDDDSFLRSISKLSLNVKINDAIIPDIFNSSKLKANKTAYNFISRRYARTKLGSPSEQDLPYVDTAAAASSATQPHSYVGYVIDRFVSSNDGLVKEKTFYIDDIKNSTFYDYSVLYGKTYIYKVRVISLFKVYTYGVNDTPELSSIYVSSRPTSTPVECYEYKPPPEPNDIKFSFDYFKRNLIITWDTPVNPQRDIKQFQVFRRKSVKEPFELIAQYCFDDTYTTDKTGRYKTGEKVDGNNLLEMSNELIPLVTTTRAAVFSHRDEEFTVDTEFFISSNYIYAICAVDAHGMISNYSSQHQVTFDPYKNRLITNLICDAGSPRQYPNMNLRVDAFKDSINVEGDNTKQMKIYFTPEYLRVKDDRNLTHQVIFAQNVKDQSPFYVLQLTNLDNQKNQIIKIQLKDPQNLTS